jgi:uncharacterized membrane protein YedE/YeeE
MQTAATLLCGILFGWGLLISGMVQPSKVIGFLDILGAWDPSLAVVMAAALITSGTGYKLIAARERPVLAAQTLWPTKTNIDASLVIGAILFGIGWGLVGLCPGPALENLATLSPRVIAFVAAMGLGVVLHRAWGIWHADRPLRSPISASADG